MKVERHRGQAASNPTGSLYEGKVITDTTFGNVRYGCMICCGPDSPFMIYDPIGVPVDGFGDQGVQAINSCSNKLVTITGDFPTWWTDNTSIATANGYQINGVAVGSTNNNALSINMYWGPKEDSGGGACPTSQAQPVGGGNVIKISQSPATLNMSAGDSGKGLTVTTNPASVASSVVFVTGSTSNPNSSATATFTYNKPTSFTGNDLWKISIGGTNSPSGTQNSQACTFGVCASQLSATSVPPQVLIQVLYGEAHGQAASGDTVSEPAIGSSIKDRFGHAEFPGGSVSTYQAVILSSQYNGINTGITAGAEPELDIAVTLFMGTQADTVAGSPCFFSPTANDWTSVENAVLSRTTTVPQLSTDPRCYSTTTPGRQIVLKGSEPDNVNGNGAPAFLFERQKASDSDPAVVTIP